MVNQTETKTKKQRGAQLEVCEYTVNYCPFCGSKKIEETKRIIPNSHTILCLRCFLIFATPCED